MASLTVLFLCVLVCSNVLGKIKSPEPLASFAIKSVIDEYFALNVKEVDIIKFGVKTGPAGKMIKETLKLEIQSVPMKIVKDARKSLKSKFKLENPSILFFDSTKNFNRTLNQIIFQEANIISHPHLVYIYNATIADIQVAKPKNHTIDKTIFLVNETPDSIELATSFLFSPITCHSNQFEVINRFTRQQKRWDNSSFFLLKYTNLHGCTLEFPVIFDNLEGISTALNFKINVKNDTEFTNLTISFIATNFPDGYEELSFYVTEIQPLKFFIPPGDLYGDYEKLFLPFDTATWIAIGVTIFVSICAILIIKWFSPNNQEIHFGRNNRSPLMNFIEILLNGFQPTALIENAPRFFLLIFMFWSLIIR
jgi:hypothetical protein